jgi:hypothetical protein
MLLESGDLIPVLSRAVEIPWTKRKNQIMNVLHRGEVTFQTMVYDSNVGDISPLSTYFNPRKWTVDDLNKRFGQVCKDEDYRSEASGYATASIPASAINPDFKNEVKSAALTPRLLLFSEMVEIRSNEFHQTTESIHNFPKISVWSIPPPSLTTPVSSKLPSPPRKSPEYQVSDDNYEPIEPPKRRRLLSNKECKKSKTKITQRPASTSSTWTPWISNETLSPFINVALDPTKNNVFAYDFDEEDGNDDLGLKGIRDELSLVKSLRKMAKAFESEDW